MPTSDAFLEQMRELFAPHGAVAIRKMFGGAGLYVSGRICAVIADNTLYLKADALTIPSFEEAGSGPFTYDMKDGRIGSMKYYRAPEEAFEDPDAAVRWIGLALEAAARAPAPKRRRPRAPRETKRA